MKPNKYLPRLYYATNQEIINTKISAIYFLLDVDRIVYIGKTDNLEARIKIHKSFFDQLEWNQFRFIECESKYHFFYEKRWIMKFKPEYNRVLTTNKKMVSIRLNIELIKHIKKEIGKGGEFTDYVETALIAKSNFKIK